MTDVIDREAESNSARVGVSDARLQELVDQARAEGLQLTGDGGLLAKLTKLVVESALEGERGHAWASVHRWAVALDDGRLVFADTDDLTADPSTSGFAG
ncbi:hypothetical protein [Rhodococcus sp. USK13]|uniref:hypothetical protein n=1 Tax=Rhodococcus sp. USK13 TaxID=2806442 RepID=UPI002016505B|nr:hypothetical protein [Rhodococcus sp. USK13]